jgi:hypothetical protein
MPGKMTKSILRPPFRPPQVPAAVRSSRLSCGKVGKAQIFTSARESSGESRVRCDAHLTCLFRSKESGGVNERALPARNEKPRPEGTGAESGLCPRRRVNPAIQASSRA